MDDTLRSPGNVLEASVSLPRAAIPHGETPAAPSKRRHVQDVPASLSALRAVAVGVGRAARQLAWRADTRLEGMRIGRTLFLLFALIIGAVLSFRLFYETACQVSIGGQTLGVIQTSEEFEEIVRRVEKRASSVLGYDYNFEHEITYEKVTVPRGAYVSAAGFETQLFKQVGDVMQAYILTVNDTFIGATNRKESLDQMLDAILSPYTDEDVTSVGFVEDVRITRQYASTEKLEARTLEEMQEMLTANTNGETTYLVVSGDTLSGIAYRNGMSLAQIQELNPDINAHRLSIGQTLIISEEIPYLSVKSTKTLQYEDEIGFDVEYVDNANLYQGDSRIVTPGVKGTALVTADITYVNGKEVTLDVIASEVLTEPSTQVVAVGTAARPKTAPTGSFIWPLSGRITSYYGYRTIFGSYSFHSGIDIAGAYGASIRAADGGKVTFAGYQGSYGYLVVISHGNGKQTYYAHCSSLLVSVGDQVYQGQTIARVGKTGRATGYHVHFEIRSNGSTVNPLSYLK